MLDTHNHVKVIVVAILPCVIFWQSELLDILSLEGHRVPQRQSWQPHHAECRGSFEGDAQITGDSHIQDPR